MSTILSSPRQLIKGDKRVVTVEDVANGCIVVSLIYQNRRYCGALMDIAKRKGPCGVPPIDSSKQSETKTVSQGNSRTPFPQPLLTRQSLKLGVPQPPLRVFPKLRKARRKVYCDLLEVDENTCDQPLKSYSSTEELSSSSTTMKRKTDSSFDNKTTSKLRIISIKTIKNEVQNKTKGLSKSLASPIKHLIPQETYSYETPVKDDFSNKLLDGKTNINNAFQNGKNEVCTSTSKIQTCFKNRQVEKEINVKEKACKQQSYKNTESNTNSQTKSVTNTLIKDSPRKRKPCSKFEIDYITFSDADDLSIPFNDKKLENIPPNPSKATNNYESITKKSTSPVSLPQASSEKIEPEMKNKKHNQKCDTGTDESHVIYVTKCRSKSGIMFTQGDVVWSKLSGYPWWPSIIEKLIVTKTNGRCLQQEAMVAWYRSTTTSILPLECIQLFNENFAIRFERRRKSAKYKKAVKEAQMAANKITPEVRKLISQFET